MKRIINTVVMLALIIINHPLTAQQTYIYQTVIEDGIIAYLRSSPTSMDAILKCKKGETVYVLDINTGSTYYKVKVNNTTGYITKFCLQQQEPAQTVNNRHNSMERTFEWAGKKYSVEKLKNLFIRERESWLRRNNYSNKERELFEEGFKLVLKALDSEGFGRNPDGSWTNSAGITSSGTRETSILGSTKHTTSNAVGIATQLLDYVMNFLPAEPKESSSSHGKSDIVTCYVIGRICIQHENYSITMENNAVLINNNQFVFINPATNETLAKIDIKNRQDSDAWHLYICSDDLGKECGVAIPKYIDMGQQLLIVQGDQKTIFVLYTAGDEKLSNDSYRKQKFSEEMGRVLQCHQLYSDAIKHYSNATYLGAKSKGVYSAMAKCYLENQQYEAAISFANKALSELPDEYCDRDEYIYNVRGCAKYILGIASYKDDLNKGGVAGQNILKEINANPQIRPQTGNKLKKDPNFKIK
jgi:hypothetical protein